MKKIFSVCLIVLGAMLAYSQSDTNAAEPTRAKVSVEDFGLAYPLSSDWVRATEMVRKRMESPNSSQNFDVLLAAMYIPKSKLSETSPFFTLLAYRQPATNCQKSLEGMTAESQSEKTKAEGGVAQFSVAGRDYYRVNMKHGVWGRHQIVVCTAAKGHLLVWYAGAPNEKGLDAIVATLDAITPLPPQSEAGSASSPVRREDGPEGSLSPAPKRPEGMQVPSGVMGGLLIKSVAPVYPGEARAAYIRGTVILRAEISKTGDITNLELMDGPIELAGSAVDAVRQWKYRPYMLAGDPVAVETQVQVTYWLH